MNSSPIKFRPLIAVLVLVSALFFVGLHRLAIDTDIVHSLPNRIPVIADAVDIFQHHPIQDQITIDIGLKTPDRDRLVACADFVEKRLKESGLFREVGMARYQRLVPELVVHVIDHLPDLFTAEELHRAVAPRLTPAAVDGRLADIRKRLAGLEGIGQAQMFAKDPLGLREIALSRLSALAPTRTGEIYRGKLISPDGRHVLVIARPKASGTNTAAARVLTALLNKVSGEMHRVTRPDNPAILTPMGAYRAALDNELMVRRDVQRALIFATLGIALLLLLAFPRPLIGLLSLLPAVMGTMTAFFFYSLFHHSISIMVLGFGGAIISITVDHGIAYLLFLDRPEETTGHDASREVWAVGLLAGLTTVGAFAVLSISGFPVLEELGQFTALGVLCSFLFVHLAFPKIFPVMPPARRRHRPPLQPVVDRLASAGKTGAVAAGLVALVLFFFAKPVFHVDLSAMNSVSQKTQAAEDQLVSVWGNVFNRIYLMTEGRRVEDLQSQGDRLLADMAGPEAKANPLSGFVPSMVFPGKDRLAANRAAWHAFWNPQRVDALSREVAAADKKYGFSTDAFAPFFAQVRATKPEPATEPIPKDLFPLLGITRGADGATLYQFVGLTVTHPQASAGWYPVLTSVGKVFDPVLFSKKLGHLLFQTFLKMMAIVGVAVVVLIFFYLLDWKLTLIALLPLAFALICTLGTLNLIGHPLDIPALMLGIVILGMGIDYSLFMVRSHQRYADTVNPNVGLVRLAVFMAAASTIIGFGVMCTADHAVLKSAGLTMLLGIGYSFLGAFLLLPPLLNRLSAPIDRDRLAGLDHRHRVLVRYRLMEAYPRLFARFKTKWDPMFAELPDLLSGMDTPRTVLDIGTGYGVPACWLAERFPGVRIRGIEPDPGRVRVAERALGADGSVRIGRAPELPGLEFRADLALMLDMVHFLDDPALRKTLNGIAGVLDPGNPLIIRAAVPPTRRFPWFWWFEKTTLKFRDVPVAYRTAETLAGILADSGFVVDRAFISGTTGDLAWLVARRLEG